MGNLLNCLTGSNTSPEDVPPPMLPSSSVISGSTTSGKGFSESSSSGNSRYSFGDNPSFGETIPESGEILDKPNLSIFSFSELKSATRNFRDESLLGEGGFGKVYKGWIDEKIVVPSSSRSGSKIAVAIKKLKSESVQGFEEWQSEVNFLGRLLHPNLVRLFGYCWEDEELLLVYEYLPKGSLENHLFRRNPGMEPLRWERRLSIALGVAQGLAFLHNSDRKVIYRDFKSANILLDANYDAKLSDFGLAKLGPTAGNSHVTTRILGTYGYAAPEYVSTGHLYVSSDVYGFGVVLLEMLTGTRALDMSRPKGQQNLMQWAKPCLSNKKQLRTIMDRRIDGQYSINAAFELAQLTLKCISLDHKARPCMDEVVKVLQKVDAIKAKPKDRQPKTGSYSQYHHKQLGSPRSPYHPWHHSSRAGVQS